MTDRLTAPPPTDLPPPAPPSSTLPKFPPDPLPPVITGATVNLLAGAPGVGKTALTAWLARCFAESTPIFGHQPGPIGKVAFLGADRSWTQSSRRWFDAAGFPDIAHYSLQDDPHFVPGRLRRRLDRLKILTEALDQLALPAASLVFVDPLGIFLGGNLNDYDACAVACMEIRRVCWERQLTVIGSAHAGKQKSDKAERYLRPQDRILGSAALFGFTDTQMYLASPQEMESDYYSFFIVSHHAKAMAFELDRDEHGLFVPVEPVERKRADPDTLDAETQSIYLQIPTFPVLVTVKSLLALFRDTVSRATLNRRLQELKKANLTYQPKHGCWARRT